MTPNEVVKKTRPIVLRVGAEGKERIDGLVKADIRPRLLPGMLRVIRWSAVLQLCQKRAVHSAPVLLEAVLLGYSEGIVKARAVEPERTTALPSPGAILNDPIGSTRAGRVEVWLRTLQPPDAGDTACLSRWWHDRIMI